MILDVLVEPDPRLHQVSRPVEKIDDEILEILHNMEETMYAYEGVGLAAPQVNIFKRLVVMDVEQVREGAEMEEKAVSVPRKAIKLINPEVIWACEEKVAFKEGCLSVPGHYADVVRPAEVKVRYLDPKGNICELHGTGLLGVCLQHEIDHLDGILYLQRISPLKREMIAKKLIKAKKSADDPAT
ncbi:MAG: peptide deformylase [Alphaproteobacteria bacterium]